MRTLFALLAICLLVLVATLFTGCGSDPDKPDMPDMIKEAAKWPPGMVPTYTDAQQQTPGGATHHGFTALSSAQLGMIDAAIDQLNLAAQADGFNKAAQKPHSFYLISTPKTPCVRSPVQQVPSFVINGGIYYDGTQWDQYNTNGRLPAPVIRNDGVELIYHTDGTSVVFAPEMVLSSGNSPGQNNGWMYVCPDAEVLINAVKHGGEHIFLFNFGYTTENRTSPPYDGYDYVSCSTYHGTIFHPLLPRDGRCAPSSFGVEVGSSQPTDKSLLIGNRSAGLIAGGTEMVKGVIHPVN